MPCTALHLVLFVGPFMELSDKDNTVLQTVLTVLYDIHTFTLRQRSQPRRETASSSGAIRVNNIAVTSQPTLPPEQMLPLLQSNVQTKEEDCL